jgi:hypothetical protein
MLFPARIFCPYCGGDSFSTATAEQAIVEQTTALADGTVLATLWIDRGPRVVARLVGADASPGQSLVLTNDLGAGYGAYIPATSL